VFARYILGKIYSLRLLKQLEQLTLPNPLFNCVLVTRMTFTIVDRLCSDRLNYGSSVAREYFYIYKIIIIKKYRT
jgi:hypothetical protein